MFFCFYYFFFEDHLPLVLQVVQPQLVQGLVLVVVLLQFAVVGSSTGAGSGADVVVTAAAGTGFGAGTGAAAVAVVVCGMGAGSGADVVVTALAGTRFGAGVVTCFFVISANWTKSFADLDGLVCFLFLLMPVIGTCFGMGLVAWKSSFS